MNREVRMDSLTEQIEKLSPTKRALLEKMQRQASALAGRYEFMMP